MTRISMRSPDARTSNDDDCNRLRHAMDAVFEELGLDAEQSPRRSIVEARMLDAFRQGPRHNLNLVDAGLRAT